MRFQRKPYNGSNPADRTPTFSSLVEECLRVNDDLCDQWFLAVRTGLTTNRVSAALCMLKAYEVVDYIEEHSTRYWFLTGKDKRVRTIDAKIKEPPGSRNRQPGYSRKQAGRQHAPTQA